MVKKKAVSQALPPKNLLQPPFSFFFNGPFAPKKEKFNTEYLTKYLTRFYSPNIQHVKIFHVNFGKNPINYAGVTPLQTWLLLHRDVWESLWSTYSNAIISFIHRILYKNVYLCKDIKWVNFNCHLPLYMVNNSC